MRIVTYNLMHSAHPALLLENLQMLIDQGADMLCLQECEPHFDADLDQLVQSLPGQWRTTYTHIGLGGNIAIAWNADRYTLQSAQTIPLPVLPRPAVSQKLRRRLEPVRRVALACVFATPTETVHVTTVHIAWEGGLRQRMRQLRHLRHALGAAWQGPHILCGDFNTVPPWFWQRWQRRKILNVLGPDYVDALPHVPWTFDASYVSPEDGIGWLTQLSGRFGVRFRSRLDYFFVRDIEVGKGGMIDLPGSDHRPLWAEFHLGRSSSDRIY